MNTVVQSSNASLASSSQNQTANSSFNYNNNDFPEDVNNTNVNSNSQSTDSNTNYDILPMAQSPASPQVSPNSTGSFKLILFAQFQPLSE